jgi:hypothetical protein
MLTHRHVLREIATLRTGCVTEDHPYPQEPLQTHFSVGILHVQVAGRGQPSAEISRRGRGGVPRDWQVADGRRAAPPARAHVRV